MEPFKRKCDDAYALGKAILTDEDYDQLFNDESGAVLEPEARGNAIALPFWMGSLNKVRTQDQLTKWLKRIDAKPDSEFVISGKLDGVSGLEYNEKLYSRGNGYTGTDYTRFLPYMNLPKTQHAVRGELIMSKKIFEEKYSAEFETSRNMVAGILNRQAIDPEIFENINFVAYDILSPPDKTPWQIFQKLESEGFTTPIHAIIHKIPKIEELEHFYNDFTSKSIYKLDGIVVKLNIPELITHGNPQNAIAYKKDFEQDQKIANVLRVDFEISRWGLYKPVIIVDPVIVNDVKISKLSGFNAKYILEKRIGKDAQLLIKRSGDVIPHIVRVLKEGDPPILPKGTWEGADLKADNCQLEDRIIRVKVLTEMIKVLGGKFISIQLVNKLYEKGVRTWFDLVTLTQEKIQSLGPQLSQNIIREISGIVASPIPIINLISSSGVFGMGIGVARIAALFKNFPNFETNRPTLKEISEIDGFSTKLASQITKYYEYMRAFLQMCRAYKLDIQPFQKPFSKPTYCISGFRDESLKDNFNIVNNVTKDCVALVVSDAKLKTEKTKKAEKLNIPIITREQLRNKIHSSLSVEEAPISSESHPVFRVVKSVSQPISNEWDKLHQHVHHLLQNPNLIAETESDPPSSELIQQLTLFQSTKKSSSTDQIKSVRVLLNYLNTLWSESIDTQILHSLLTSFLSENQEPEVQGLPSIDIQSLQVLPSIEDKIDVYLHPFFNALKNASLVQQKRIARNFLEFLNELTAQEKSIAQQYLNVINQAYLNSEVSINQWKLCLTDIDSETKALTLDKFLNCLVNSKFQKPLESIQEVESREEHEFIEKEIDEPIQLPQEILESREERIELPRELESIRDDVNKFFGPMFIALNESNLDNQREIAQSFLDFLRNLTEKQEPIVQEELNQFNDFYLHTTLVSIAQWKRCLSQILTRETPLILNEFTNCLTGLSEPKHEIRESELLREYETRKEPESLQETEYFLKETIEGLFTSFLNAFENPDFDNQREMAQSFRDFLRDLIDQEEESIAQEELNYLSKMYFQREYISLTQWQHCLTKILSQSTASTLSQFEDCLTNSAQSLPTEEFESIEIESQQEDVKKQFNDLFMQFFDSLNHPNLNLQQYSTRPFLQFLAGIDTEETVQDELEKFSQLHLDGSFISIQQLGACLKKTLYRTMPWTLDQFKMCLLNDDIPLVKQPEESLEKMESPQYFQDSTSKKFANDLTLFFEALSLQNFSLQQSRAKTLVDFVSTLSGEKQILAQDELKRFGYSQLAIDFIPLDRLKDGLEQVLIKKPTKLTIEQFKDFLNGPPEQPSGSQNLRDVGEKFANELTLFFEALNSQNLNLQQSRAENFKNLLSTLSEENSIVAQDELIRSSYSQFDGEFISLSRLKEGIDQVLLQKAKLTVKQFKDYITKSSEPFEGIEYLSPAGEDFINNLTLFFEALDAQDLGLVQSRAKTLLNFISTLSGGKQILAQDELKRFSRSQLVIDFISLDRLRQGLEKVLHRGAKWTVWQFKDFLDESLPSGSSSSDPVDQSPSSSGSKSKGEFYDLLVKFFFALENEDFPTQWGLVQQIFRATSTSAKADLQKQLEEFSQENNFEDFFVSLDQLEYCIALILHRTGRITSDEFQDSLRKYLESQPKSKRTLLPNPLFEDTFRELLMRIFKNLVDGEPIQRQNEDAKTFLDFLEADMLTENEKSLGESELLKFNENNRINFVSIDQLQYFLDKILRQRKESSFPLFKEYLDEYLESLDPEEFESLIDSEESESFIDPEQVETFIKETFQELLTNFFDALNDQKSLQDQQDAAISLLDFLTSLTASGKIIAVDELEKMNPAKYFEISISIDQLKYSLAKMVNQQTQLTRDQFQNYVIEHSGYLDLFENTESNESIGEEFFELFTNFFETLYKKFEQQQDAAILLLDFLISLTASGEIMVENELENAKKFNVVSIDQLEYCLFKILNQTRFTTLAHFQEDLVEYFESEFIPDLESESEESDLESEESESQPQPDLSTGDMFQESLTIFLNSLTNPKSLQDQQNIAQEFLNFITELSDDDLSIAQNELEKFVHHHFGDAIYISISQLKYHLGKIATRETTLTLNEFKNYFTNVYKSDSPESSPQSLSLEDEFYYLLNPFLDSLKNKESKERQQELAQTVLTFIIKVPHEKEIDLQNVLNYFNKDDSKFNFQSLRQLNHCLSQIYNQREASDLDQFQNCLTQELRQYPPPGMQYLPQEMYSSEMQYPQPEMYSSQGMYSSPGMYSSQGMFPQPEMYSSQGMFPQPEMYSSQGMFPQPEMYSSPGMYSSPEMYSSPGMYSSPEMQYPSQFESRHVNPLSKKLISISKSLSKLLRHTGPVDKEGYIQISRLLTFPQFNQVTFQDILYIVKNDDKGRFHIENENDDRIAKVRATQGHSIPGLDLGLERLDSIDSDVIHGTYRRHLPSIQKNGLFRGKRGYIHMTTRINPNQVTSGFRKDAEIAIYIDANQAIREGFLFFRSKNGVILCPGNDQGYLPAIYIIKIQDLSTGYVQFM